MAELVDALVSGISDASRGGSSPLLGTKSILTNSYRIFVFLSVYIKSMNIISSRQPSFGLSDALPSELARGYGTALKNSRRVRRFRAFLPLFAVTAAALITLFSVINPLSLFIPFEVGKVVINGSKLTMETPTLSGYMSDRRKYFVRAEKAEQDLKSPLIVDLFKMQADVEMEGGGSANLRAENGQMLSDKEQIHFKNGVWVSTTTGYSGKASEAFVDSKAARIVVPVPVDLLSPTGAMRADRMEIKDSGKYMLFEGRVSGYFQPSKPDNETTAQHEKKPQ
jgi:lipopolysaccharide export system protein LptC